MSHRQRCHSCSFSESEKEESPLSGKHEWIRLRVVRKGNPGWGGSRNVVGTAEWKCAYGGFTTWQLTAVSLLCHPPDTRTKTGIFRIMSIIYASCLSSGYNQKPTRASSHTQCDLSAVSSRTVFQTRRTVTISGVWKTSVQPLCCRAHIYAIVYHVAFFLCAFRCMK